jgi:hypothetical protein
MPILPTQVAGLMAFHPNSAGIEAKTLQARVKSRNFPVNFPYQGGTKNSQWVFNKAQ